MFIKELYQADQSSFDCFPRLASEICQSSKCSCDFGFYAIDRQPGLGLTII